MARSRARRHVFHEGDTVRLFLPYGVCGVDQEGREHDLSADDLASVESAILRKHNERDGSGCQYEIMVPVAPGWTDEKGDDLAIMISIHDSDRGADGNLPMEHFVPVNVAPSQGGRRPRP